VPQDEVSLVQMKLESSKPESLNEAVEAGKRELREYAEELKHNEAEAGIRELHEYAEELKRGWSADLDNATLTSGLPMSTSCPIGFDTTDATNKASFNFADKCLQTVNPHQLAAGDLSALASCTGRHANSIKTGQDRVEFDTKGTSAEGSICDAKVYKVRCDGGKLRPGCDSVKLWRGYTKSKKNQWGAYWAAGNPKSLNKKTYRERYAICDGWNPGLDGVWSAVLNNNACGSYVMIGNGESVTNCPDPSQQFAYSPYLQVVMCAYPPANSMAGQDENAAGWAA